MKKMKYWENPEEKIEYKKNNKYVDNPLQKRKYEKKKIYEKNSVPKGEYEKKYLEHPESKREYEKNKYEKNPEPKKENRKKLHKKKKKYLSKVQKFCQQIRQSPCFIGAFISTASDYLNMKNIFLLQKCVFQ